jgi:hypothetical protein
MDCQTRQRSLALVVLRVGLRLGRVTTVLPLVFYQTQSNHGVLAEGITHSFRFAWQGLETSMLTIIIAVLATFLVGGVTLTAYLWYLTPNPHDRV